MVPVAVVEIAVERLLLGEPLGGVGADRRAHVAEDRRRVSGNARSPGLDVEPCGCREGGGHPVEEGAVECRAGEPAHPRTHRGEHQADAAERRAKLRQGVGHPGQGPLGEARSDAEPESIAVEAEAVDVGRDLVRRVTVEGHHRDAELELGGSLGESGERLEPERPGVIVRPQRGVSELGTALRQPGGDGRIEPRRDPEPAPPSAARRLPTHRSSTATHSTCGVCGNMSTGCTRRSV